MIQHWGLVAFGDRQVPYSIIASAGLEPEASAPVLVALEWVLDALRLTDRTDPLTKIVANKLIGLAREGERDPERLCKLTLQAIQPQAGDAGPLAR
jgi:hypothetical protein